MEVLEALGTHSAISTILVTTCIYIFKVFLQRTDCKDVAKYFLSYFYQYRKKGKFFKCSCKWCCKMLLFHFYCVIPWHEFRRISKNYGAIIFFLLSHLSYFPNFMIFFFIFMFWLNKKQEYQQMFSTTTCATLTNACKLKKKLENQIEGLHTSIMYICSYRNNVYKIDTLCYDIRQLLHKER